MAKTDSKKNASLKKLNETGVRKSDDRRQIKMEIPVERRKISRRRQIDPTTCERDYTEIEIEFMQAMDEYKQASGRMFPTCSEILEVVIKLGYRKVCQAQPESPIPAPVNTNNLYLDDVSSSIG